VSLVERRRRFFRIARRVSIFFMVGGLIAAAQMFYAIQTGQIWHTESGDIIPAGEMQEVFFAFLTVAALGVVVFLGTRWWARKYDE
jgi:hypothetical protein